MSKPKLESTKLAPPQAHQGYRPETVSRYTGFSVHLIYRECRAGNIRHVRVGRALTIPGTEVIRLTGGQVA